MKLNELIKEYENTIQIPDLRGDVAYSIKINSNQSVVLSYNYKCPKWKLFERKNMLKDSLNAYTKKEYKNLFSKPTLQIAQEDGKSTTLKWNNYSPYIYSEKLEKDIVITISSELSGSIGFARALSKDKLKEFVIDFIEREIEYRNKYNEATLKFGFNSEYDIYTNLGSYESPRIKIFIATHNVEDDTTQEYMRYINETIEEHTKPSTLDKITTKHPFFKEYNMLIIKLQFLREYGIHDALKTQIAWIHFDKMHLLIEKNVECTTSKKYSFTIDELFTMINSAKEAQSSLNNNEEESKDSIEENQEESKDSIEDNEEEYKLIKRNTVDKKINEQDTDKKKLEIITSKDVEIEENPKTKEAIDKSVCNCDIFINANAIYDNEILNHPDILNRFTTKHGIDKTQHLINLCFDIGNIDIDYSLLEEVESLMGVD